MPHHLRCSSKHRFGFLTACFHWGVYSAEQHKAKKQLQPRNAPIVRLAATLLNIWRPPTSRKPPDNSSCKVCPLKDTTKRASVNVPLVEERRVITRPKLLQEIKSLLTHSCHSFRGHKMLRNIDFRLIRVANDARFFLKQVNPTPI